ETSDGPDPQLHDLLQRLDHANLDVVLVEGFKKEDFPKIELHRPSLGAALLSATDHSIIAIATDGPLSAHPPVPILDLNDAAGIVSFIVQTFCLDTSDA